MATVVITGGSRGIGAAAVRLFAQQGHLVYFLYEKEHEAAKWLTRENLNSVDWLPADVTILDQVRELL